MYEITPLPVRKLMLKLNTRYILLNVICHFMNCLNDLKRIAGKQTVKRGDPPLLRKKMSPYKEKEMFETL